MEEKKCQRCGKCCGKCKFLIKLEKSTVCRIYRQRIGTKINDEFACDYRVNTTYDYENCPLNTGKEIYTHDKKTD